MIMQISFNFTHWMLGFAFDRYNCMISIGPFIIMLSNSRLYEKDRARYEGGNYNE